jgi:predicted nucleotidyltransferase
MSNDLFLRYINSVKTLVERFKSEIVSIILFGSLVNEQSKQSSSTDVDILVIVSDSCSKIEFNKIKHFLFQLENLFFSRYRKNESTFFSIGLQSATGMFMNIFICRFSDFKKRKFHRVFNVNPIVATLLAPQNSVWISLLKRHQIIYGRSVFKDWVTSPRISSSDLIKSFIMNSLLSLGALVFFPIHKQVIKFSMEAMKWSLFTWSNFNNLPVMPLNQVIVLFIRDSSLIERRAIHDFVLYREKRNVRKYLPILSLLFVFKLHLSILRNS